MTPTGFCVFLRRPDQWQTEKAAAFLAAYRKVLLFDVRQTIRRAWGFLGENLSESEAQALAAAAQGAGFEVLTVPAETLPRPVDPRIIHKANFSPGGIVYTRGTASDAHSLPWSTVRLLAAAAVKEDVSVTKTVHEGPTAQERAVRMGISMMTGIPLGGGKGRDVQKTTTASNLSLLLDIHATGEEGAIRLRVNPDQFDFSVLGDRRALNALANLRALLDDIVRLAPGVPRNLGADIFLSGRPLNQMGYDIAADFEKETRWLLALR